MAATQYGTKMEVAAQGTMTGYYVASLTAGGADVDLETVDDENGAEVNVTVFKQRATYDMELIVKDGFHFDAKEGEKFPTAVSNTLNGGADGTNGLTLTDYWITSLRRAKSRGATRITMTLMYRPLALVP